MPNLDTLIRTRLRLLLTRPGLVARPRLQARIAEGLRGLLTLITAPNARIFLDEGQPMQMLLAQRSSLSSFLSRRAL